MRRALAALLLAASPALAGENRLHVCEVELVGPLERFELDLGASASTRVPLALLPGERRTLRVPVPAALPEALGGPEYWPLPEVRGLRGEGSVRPLRWIEDPGADDWARVTPGLRLRNRPPVPGGPRVGGPGALLLLAAGLALALGARRRPRTALASGPLLAVAFWVLPLCGEGGGAVIVYEADAAASIALCVQGHRDWIAFGLADRLEVRPEGAAIAVARLEGGGLGPRWVARAPGAELFTVSVRPGPWLSGAPLDVSRATARWTRSAGGGAPGGAGWNGPDEPPPGWIVAGLPLGTGVLLARFDGEADETWLRLTGWTGP